MDMFQAAFVGAVVRKQLAEEVMVAMEGHCSRHIILGHQSSLVGVVFHRVWEAMAEGMPSVSTVLQEVVRAVIVSILPVVEAQVVVWPVRSPASELAPAVVILQAALLQRWRAKFAKNQISKISDHRQSLHVLRRQRD